MDGAVNPSAGATGLALANQFLFGHQRATQQATPAAVPEVEE
jgi:hypothetical protein